jgi:hypothetical protein
MCRGRCVLKSERTLQSPASVRMSRRVEALFSCPRTSRPNARIDPSKWRIAERRPSTSCSVRRRLGLLLVGQRERYGFELFSASSKNTSSASSILPDSAAGGRQDGRVPDGGAVPDRQPGAVPAHAVGGRTHRRIGRRGREHQRNDRHVRHGTGLSDKTIRGAFTSSWSISTGIAIFV